MRGGSLLGGPTKAAFDMPRSAKRLLAMAVDAAICIFTVWLALSLRLDQWVMIASNQWLAVIASVVIALPIFVISGMYRAIFRYMGWDALRSLALACGVYGLVFASLFTFLGVSGVPRTVGLIQPALLFLFVGASRASVRRMLGGQLRALNGPRVMIYGAGSSGRQLAAAIAGSAEMYLFGFIDDDRRLHRSILRGKRIYSPDKLPSLVERHGITDILLAIPSATRQRRNQIIEALGPLSVSVRTLPDIMDIAHGRVEVSNLRELEIEDLLGRDAAAPKPALFERNILGKTVLVTGAGGSIGSELCRQILTAGPARLVLVESSEYALYAIHGELDRRRSGLSADRIVPLLASVRDEAAMRHILRKWQPDTVYHAAAYKHVPLVEHNPIEGILNNVFGTMTAALAARDANVSDFVLISTDKAVRPTNVMGASKRLAEMVLQGLTEEGGPTRFSMVRFGNVLGSSGSVVPLFRSQIAAGGPITLTHREITRYFMTIPEAAQLVIQAGAMASGGEVFILDMGEPVRIIDLARKMVALSGMTVRDIDNPDGDVEIVTVGLRPGEKLYEELLIGDDPTNTAHPQIMKAREKHLPMSSLRPLLDQLSAAMEQRDLLEVRRMLRAIVAEYNPERAGAPDERARMLRAVA